nr:MAG TPA: hypothetical protein [Caudoviricetes sp.]
MGQKYYIEGLLSGNCRLIQENSSCRSFIKMVVLFAKYIRKYPIVNIRFRNGYCGCATCTHGQPLCYRKED